MLDQSTLMIKHYGTDDIAKIEKMKKEDIELGGGIPGEELVKMPIPYYAPDSALPPIPTAEDVANAQTPENIARARSLSTSSYIYRISGVYCVKFSRKSSVLQEAENLLFLQEHEVRSPKVYAVFSNQGTDPVSKLYKPRNPGTPLRKYYYLVMEFIEGIAIDDAQFCRLAPEARIKIYDKIGEQIRLLRSIPAPNPNYYGRINNQPYHPYCMLVNYRRRCPVGPFTTYRAFLEQLYISFENALISQLCWRPVNSNPQVNPQHQLLAASFFDSFGEFSESGDSKLSHMDIKLQNMILVPSASNPSDKLEDYDLHIIDWEYMAWMPAWAEATSVMKRLPPDAPDEVDDEKPYLPEWRVSSGIKPFYYAQAIFWQECAGAFGNTGI